MDAAGDQNQQRRLEPKSGLARTFRRHIALLSTKTTHYIRFRLITTVCVGLRWIREQTAPSEYLQGYLRNNLERFSVTSTTFVCAGSFC